MDYPIKVPGVGLVDGKFVDEDTATGQAGSLIPAAWGSAVTDEILNVIKAAGLLPEESDNGQLLKAVNAIILKNIPAEKVRTTLAEYGITDAYRKEVTLTKTEIATKLKEVSDLIVPVEQATEAKKGIARFGTAEEQVAGTLKDVIANPAGLMAILARWFPTRALTENDYIRLPDIPGGTIIQVGYVLDDGTTKNFPTAFPTKCTGLVSSLDSDSFGGGSVTSYIVSRTQFRIREGGSVTSNVYMRYIAIGF